MRSTIILGLLALLLGCGTVNPCGFPQTNQACTQMQAGGNNFTLGPFILIKQRF